MSRFGSIFYTVLGTFMLVLVGCESTSEEPINNSISEAQTSIPEVQTPVSESSSPYQIKGAPVPKGLNFAGEPVPLNDEDVANRLDHELLVNMYWQSQTVLFHKRAARWFPIIEPILKEEGIPDDFKYLALIESGFTGNVSPSGAAGFWQFLAQTGRDYGLIVNDEVDERYHPEKATRAACKYFKSGYEKFGNWTAAAASYNMGRTGYQRQLDRQKVDSYYDLLLNSETSRYVFRILAVKSILSDSETYGFFLSESELYQPYTSSEIEITSTIDTLANWALDHKTNYKGLKILNPWLRQNTLTVAPNESFTIKIPQGAN